MVNTISNVDPGKYSYIELLQDVGELSLSHVSAVIEFAINLHCDIPGSNDRMIVSNDLDVLKMFEIHNSREINIYVTTMSAVPCHTIDVNETVTISSQTSEDEISDSDDVYGLTSEDEAFVPSVGENLRNFTFNTATSPTVNVEVHSGGDLSDFESNDDAEYNPNSNDNSTDEGEVSLDGNNGLFSIAVEVVESENRDSWGFFLQNLNTVIGAHSSEVP
ncbi:hypothetical protein F0562_007734 [Nyssa sinensis]|uniref:Uncharacterized protein n=1 Tax=Nyssa sinensis TaxID=561372 RepID=A0A5J5A6I4_9ASTE|nr:hypothetical protein F0562_007734 [Nyssa sinensis]